MTTTKPRRPHRGTLDRYEYLIGEVGAALLFPEVCDAEIKRKLAERAAAIRAEAAAIRVQADGLYAQAGLLQRYADDGQALCIWIRRNRKLVGELIAAAEIETPAKGCNPAGVGITIQQDRIEREQPQYRPGT